MEVLHVEQSLPICMALAAIGGFLEVAATAVTAMPQVRERQTGHPVKPRIRWLCIGGNVFLQTISGFFSALFATWYGPVSIVVPFFYSSTLLCNMIVFGLLLGETLSKNMRVGTNVIILATILLPVVGPDVVPEQTFSYLISKWYSVLWFFVLAMVTVVTGGILISHAGPSPDCIFQKHYSKQQRTIVLLFCRAASISIDLTVSRCLVLLVPNKVVFTALVITKLISGNLYTYAIVIQSYAVQQSEFVPLNATMIILINAITGILVWDDHPKSWYGYVCAFCLLGIGCDLLLTVPLLNAENPEFGNASITKKHTPTTTSAQTKPTTLSSSLEVETQTDDDEDDESIAKQLSYTPNHHSSLLSSNNQQQYDELKKYQSFTSPRRQRTRSSNFVEDGGTMSRRQAWRETISPAKQRIRTRSYDAYSPQQWDSTTTTTPSHAAAGIDLSPVREKSSPGRFASSTSCEDDEEELFSTETTTLTTPSTKH